VTPSSRPFEAFNRPDLVVCAASGVVSPALRAAGDRPLPMLGE